MNTEKLGLYKFQFDCGRMGMLYGLFIAPVAKVDELIKSGQEVYFGEVLGKHSEISGPIDAGDVTLLTDNPEDIAWAQRLKVSCGFNPFDYIETDEEDDS